MGKVIPTVVGLEGESFLRGLDATMLCECSPFASSSHTVFASKTALAAASVAVSWFAR